MSRRERERHRSQLSNELIERANQIVESIVAEELEEGGQENIQARVEARIRNDYALNPILVAILIQVATLAIKYLIDRWLNNQAQVAATPEPC